VAKATAAAVGELWPSGRGRQGRYGWSEHTGPGELSAATLAWNWSHPRGRFATMTFGTVMDSELNIYLTAADALRKFSPDGRLLWTHTTLPAENMNAPLLMDGMVFMSQTFGSVYALSAQTGDLLWRTRLAKFNAADNGFVMGHEGVLVVAGGAYLEFNPFVSGVNASDGTEIWRFRTDAPIWNFAASFPDDGTLVFQDLEGRAYRTRLREGTLIWKAGGVPGTWTDGTATLGANGVVYAVAVHAAYGQARAETPGELSAYRLSDGHLLWRIQVQFPPNNAPAVGKLYGMSNLSVVQPLGQQVLQGAPTAVAAFDAETGKMQWRYEGPRQQGILQAGDGPGILERLLNGVRPLCLPNPWGAPVIDAAGTVYLGNQEGLFMALRDVDGNGVIDGPEEVSGYDTGACFGGSAGPSVAPGRIAVASCDTLFVFRSREKGSLATG